MKKRSNLAHKSVKYYIDSSDYPAGKFVPDHDVNASECKIKGDTRLAKETWYYLAYDKTETEGYIINLKMWINDAGANSGTCTGMVAKDYLGWPAYIATNIESGETV